MLNFAPAIPSRSDLEWCWFLRRQGRAGEAIERALHDIGIMHPGGWADWQNSTLTDTGSPIEMQFSTTSKALRLIAKISDPGTDPAEQLGHVYNIMADLDGTLPPDALRDVLGAAQGAGPLTYGALLGLKHDGIRLHSSLNAELPIAATDLSNLLSPNMLASTLATLDGQTRSTMLGYDGSTGQITLHFETDSSHRSILPILAEPAQVSPDVLSHAIDGLMRSAPDSAMPTNRLGFSYTVADNGAPPQLTLYFSAKELFGDDGAILARLKACGGRALHGYAALIDHLAPAPVGKTHHGRVGLTARQNAAPSLSVGVAAPWYSSEDAV